MMVTDEQPEQMSDRTACRVEDEETRERADLDRAIAEETRRAAFTAELEEMDGLASGAVTPPGVEGRPARPPPPVDPTRIFHEQLLNEVNKIHADLAAIGGVLKTLVTHQESRRLTPGRVPHRDDELDLDDVLGDDVPDDEETP